jgi:mannose-6-phosphate isomerase-like protein (cupin superfamily)
MLGAGSPNTRIVLSSEEGEMVWFNGLGVRFMREGLGTGGTFALVEHPIEPRTLATPIHRHRHEDEYTYVLEGAVGVQVGEEVRIARPGDLVLSPATCRMPFKTQVMRRRGHSRSSPRQASNGISGRSRHCSPHQ